ncbi:hypothetical protein [Streptomyces sp. NPDC018972]|uniref:hypothetical protein n=1 Tax=Streptomyces sp. NPDC018972 TaxID=3365060 RepID=UPI0037A591F6
MWHVFLLSALAGLMGANAVPHFVKGVTGEEFPNVWGNDPLRNAVAGTFGLALAGAFGYGAGLPAHPLAGALGLLTGALAMAVFHGLGGAYRLNSALGRPNPPRASHAETG